jgi:hypothetical protein
MFVPKEFVEALCGRRPEVPRAAERGAGAWVWLTGLGVGEADCGGAELG